MATVQQPVMTKIEDLKPYEFNIKKHTKTQIDGIAESMKKYGIYAPIVVDKDNNVVIGHGRLEAAKLLNLSEFPVIKYDSLSETDAKALRLLDNRISESDWDIDNLKHEMENIQFPWEDFHVNFDDLYQPQLQNITIDVDPSDQHMQSYLHGNIKQITLIFSNDEFERTMDRMEKAGKELGADSNTEILLKLLDHYESS